MTDEPRVAPFFRAGGAGRVIVHLPWLPPLFPFTHPNSSDLRESYWLFSSRLGGLDP